MPITRTRTDCRNILKEYQKMCKSYGDVYRGEVKCTYKKIHSMDKKSLIDYKNAVKNNIRILRACYEGRVTYRSDCVDIPNIEHEPPIREAEKHLKT